MIENPEHRYMPRLLKLRRTLAKGFDCKKESNLRDCYFLCFYAFLQGDPDLDEHLDILTDCRFDRNFDRWFYIESGLALKARLARLREDLQSREVCLRRIREIGFVESRANGSLLRGMRHDVESARLLARKPGITLAQRRAALGSEASWLERLSMELIFIIEIRRDSRDVAILERELDIVLADLSKGPKPHSE